MKLSSIELTEGRRSILPLIYDCRVCNVINWVLLHIFILIFILCACCVIDVILFLLILISFRFALFWVYVCISRLADFDKLHPDYIVACTSTITVKVTIAIQAYMNLEFPRSFKLRPLVTFHTLNEIWWLHIVKDIIPIHDWCRVHIIGLFVYEQMLLMTSIYLCKLLLTFHSTFIVTYELYGEVCLLLILCSILRETFGELHPS